MLAHSAYKLGMTARNRVRNLMHYSFEIHEGDRMFVAVQEALIAVLPVKQRRTVEVASSSRHSIEPDGVGRTGESPLSLRFSGSVRQKFRFEGHWINAETTLADHFGGGEGNYRSRLKLVRLSVYGEDARDACLRWLDGIHRELQRGARAKPGYWTPGHWSGFGRTMDLPVRPFSSVVLRDPAAADVLRSDIASFYASEASYATMGIPWHRGYMLSGPPGCGKTSFVAALASDLGRDLYYVPLTRLGSDQEITRLFQEVSQRSFLLLEDIDVLAAAQDRSEGHNLSDNPTKLSLSGLLNALDGIGTPHGLVLFLTTNRPEVLDRAVYRPGRIDIHLPFVEADDEQVRRMTALYLSPVHAERLRPMEGTIPPASVVGAFKRYITDRDAALAELERVIAERGVDESFLDDVR